MNTQKDVLDIITHVVEKITIGNKNPQEGSPTKGLTVGKIMRVSRGCGISLINALEYIRGWDYYAYREFPPDFKSGSFEERGYTDASRIIG